MEFVEFKGKTLDEALMQASVRYFSTFYDFLQQQKFENIVKNAIFLFRILFYIAKRLYFFLKK